MFRLFMFLNGIIFFTELKIFIFLFPTQGIYQETRLVPLKEEFSTDCINSQRCNYFLCCNLRTIINEFEKNKAWFRKSGFHMITTMATIAGVVSI